MPNSSFFRKKPSGFSMEIDDTMVSPFLYQPTPKGMRFLAAHYSAKYRIDLRCVDLRGKFEPDQTIIQYFRYIQTSDYLTSLEEGKTLGLVLSHGQQHAVPLLARKKDGKLDLVVFDSTSGASVGAYFPIAELFPEATFYLKSGTRQVDSNSCMTDAFCILKEALQIDTLFDLLNAKKNEHHRAVSPIPPSGRRLLFERPAKPENFILFKMPERLLLTAQSSKFVTDADADLAAILRGGRSLGEYRDHFRISVSLTKGSENYSTEINSYLFNKSREHKERFKLQDDFKKELMETVSSRL
jgi:hypothetical protein